MATFAEKVRAELRRRKLSQADLADAIGTHQPTVSSWLSDGIIPKPDFLVRISRVLDLSLDYLLDDGQDRPAGRDGFTDVERKVWDLAHAIGLEEAYLRLAMAGTSPTTPKPGRTPGGGAGHRPIKGEVAWPDDETTGRNRKVE